MVDVTLRRNPLPQGLGMDRSEIWIRPSATSMLTLMALLFVLHYVDVARAEAPDGYYDLAKGQTGVGLKDALHRIVDGHRPLPYTATGNDNWYDRKDIDVWEALAYTDSACPDNNPTCGKVQLLYLEETRDLSQAYRGGTVDCKDLWEREHVWPKSRGFPKKGQDGYTDLHHIRPADRDINNSHSNYGYNVGGDSVDDKKRDCSVWKSEAKLSRETESFEPPDRAKGQVARMLLYMAVRYEEGDNESPENMPDLYLKPVNKKERKPWIGHLCRILEWNRMYRPTEFEKRRNDRVMELQNNRNPFIDNPAWADEIWHGCPGVECCEAVLGQ